MGRGIYPPGHAGNDGQTRLGEAPGKRFGEPYAVGRAVARADHGNHGAAHEMGVPQH
jgi:hypothetical protein